MSIMTMNAAELSKQIGETVSDLEVMIAKNSIVGTDSITIAELLGCTAAEIQEVQLTQTYKSVRMLLASEYGRTQVEADFNWDFVEAEAIKGLAKRVVFEKDSDTLLRIAAVANKAQRRSTSHSGVLDPSAGSARVPLTLTSRIVKRLNAKTGETSVEETRQISVIDGSATNPSFEDIDQLLGVSQRPQIAKVMGVKTHEPEFGIDDIPSF